MTTQVLCDYEGAGPAGTTLTNANTGGTVAIGVGCTAVSTATAGFGALAGLYSCPATNVSSRTTTSITGGTKQGVLSVKFQIPTGFATTKRFIVLQGTGSVTACSFNYNGSTNQLQLQNAAGAGTVTVTNVLSLATFYRFEFIHTIGVGTTDGIYSLNVYQGDSKTPINGAPFTSAVYNLGTVSALAVQHGITANGTTVAADIIIDSVRYDPGGTTELGPEAIPVTAGGSVGIGGTVPAQKSAPAVAGAPLGLSGVAGAGKRALSVNRAAVGLTTRGASTKRAVVAGRATAGLAGTAAGRKVARAAAARALVGLGGTGAGRKAATVSGRACVGLWGALGPVIVPPTIGTHLGTVGARASLIGSAGDATMTGTTTGGSSLIGGTR